MDDGTEPWQHGKQPKNQKYEFNPIHKLCLGLSNKINLARNWTTTYGHDIIFLQESEITLNTDIDWLQIAHYDFYHTPIGSSKSRIAAYIKSSINYIVDIAESVEAITFIQGKKAITGVYRPFKVTNHTNYINDLVSYIRKFSDYDLTIIGDMNLDYNQISNNKYQHSGCTTSGLNLLTN